MELEVSELEVSEPEDDLCKVEAEGLLKSLKGQVSNDQQRQSLVLNQSGQWFETVLCTRLCTAETAEVIGQVFLDKYIS